MNVRNSIRRPRTQNSDFVARLLKHLEARRFEGAPRHLGVDETGRDIFSYIPGEVPADLGLFTPSQLTHGARLLRSFHDATSDFPDKGSAQVVCHGDASPCNYVFTQGLPQALIDFDDAHPGSRLEDLGYAAWLWLDIGNEEIAPHVQHERLHRFVCDYGLPVGDTNMGKITPPISTPVRFGVSNQEVTDLVARLRQGLPTQNGAPASAQPGPAQAVGGQQGPAVPRVKIW